MIGRRFFNDIVLNLINEILKNEGCIISFEKIQQDVVYDLIKKNKKNYYICPWNKFLRKRIYIEEKTRKNIIIT